MTAADRAHLNAQLGRIVRLLAFTLFSSAIVVNLVNTAAVRYPLLGVAIGLLEVIYRTAVPTVAMPAVASVLAPPAAKADTAPPTPPPGG